ncbi:MAG: 30S ribosomal protein S3 [Candidatus Omnitrophota bacterium]
MGQKVHPFIQRIGINKSWLSLWFAKKKEFPKNLEEDYKIRKLITTNYRQASIARVIIERLGGDKIKVRICSGRPGVLIGRHGSEIEQLKAQINKITSKELIIEIEDIKQPALDAQLISENIALQLEKRIAFRRAIKRAMEQALNAGCEGIKVSCGGRLGGAEMSRTETYKQGKVPLQTLRANIDYGFAQAATTYGYIGVKTWVYKGDIFSKPVDSDSNKIVDNKEG